VSARLRRDLSRTKVAFGVLAAAGGTIAAIAACSAPAVPATNRGTSSGATGDPTSTATSTASSAPDAGSPCQSKTTYQDCVVCCGQTATTFQATSKKFDDCACATPCASDCAAYCANRSSDPDDTCIKCLNANATETACASQADAVCAADPSCQNVAQCEQAAGCTSKPDLDAGGDGG
jgi:hypothetical protein